MASTRTLGGEDGLAGAIKDPKLTGVRDAGGPENEVNGFGFQYDEKGRAVNRVLLPQRSGSGQLQPPDNSGDWFFNTARRGEGPFGLGVWELKPEAAARRAAAEKAFLDEGMKNDPGGFNAGSGYSPFGHYDRTPAAPAPAPVPARLPAPAPQPSSTPTQAVGGRYEIVFNVGGQQSKVYTDTDAEARRVIDSLELAFRTGG